MPWFKSREKPAELVASDTSPNGVYSGLRENALSITRADAGIPSPSADSPGWGILMETGHGEVTVTLFALADGTTSLYFSNGAGVIGGQAHEAVRRANQEFLSQANKFLRYLKPCQSFPIPEASHTVFYVLTDSGIFTGGALEADLGYGRDPLSPLFHAGHEVISQLRLISEPSEGHA